MSLRLCRCQAFMVSLCNEALVEIDTHNKHGSLQLLLLVYRSGNKIRLPDSHLVFLRHIQANTCDFKSFLRYCVTQKNEFKSTLNWGEYRRLNENLMCQLSMHKL